MPRGNITELPKGADGTKRWRLRVGAGKDPLTGRKRYVSEVYWGPKREANNRLVKIANDVTVGRRRGTAVPFSTLLERWLLHRHNAGKVSGRTLEMDEKEVARALPELGHISLDKLHARDLDIYYALLQERGLSANSIQGAHRVLSGALTQAVKWEWISTNPAASAEPPASPPTVVVAPTLEEVRALLNLIGERNPDLGVLLWLAVTTGARRSELCALRWEDINATDRSMVIQRHLQQRGKGHVVKPGSKNGKNRRLALDDMTLAVLAKHRVRMDERAKAGELVLAPEAYVFSRSIDGSDFLNPDNVTHRIGDARDKLGLRHLHLHSMRHFQASVLGPAGVDIRTIAGRGGHDPVEALKTYAHFLSAPDREAADIMGELLRPRSSC